MTWFVKDGGYELFFNRDERVSRRHADLPALQVQDGVQYISPTDTDAGGTWIAANQFGVTVCLLNHYEFEQIATYKDWTSRGEIVRRLATVEHLHEVVKKFQKMDLHNFRAFRLFTINRHGNNRLCIWDGHQARVEVDVEKPKSSSSVDALQVKRVRKQLFDDLGLYHSQDSQQFLRYHASHRPDKSQESVCMHRHDANTVSFSYVDVSHTGVAFSYADGSPCVAALGEPLELCIEPESAERALQRSLAMAANI